MMEPLPLDYLASVKDRCDGATPGPWISYVEGRDHTGGSNVIVRGNHLEEDLYLSGGTIADQDFIAHARQDIPRLLDEIYRLRALLS